MEDTINKVNIDNLYLDPNNYRFIDSDRYVKVDEGQVRDVRVQNRTLKLLLGKNQEYIQDLLLSMKENGFLNVETIQVRRITDSQDFLVLEGNRRVATLKYLHQQYKDDGDIGNFDATFFSHIPISIIDSNDIRAQLITMGLQHITGKKRWNPLNQSQMVIDLIDRYGLTNKEIRDSLGTSQQFINKCRRTMALITAYKKGDYGDQFRSEMYSIFEEVVKSPQMREWLGWDDVDMNCKNLVHQEFLFQWISTIEDDNDETGETRQLQPIITKSQEIRTLSKFISDEKAVNVMERKRDVTVGYTMSSAVGEDRLDNALHDIENSINIIETEKEHIDQSKKSVINELRQRINRLTYSTKSLNLVSSYYYSNIQQRFSSLNIKHYRGLNNIKLDKFHDVNLFVGLNNSGKTMILEALFLMTKMNDVTKILDLERFRSKASSSISYQWLVDNLNSDAEISGVFNGSICQYKFERFQDEDNNLDKNGYLSSLKVSEKIGAGNTLTSQLHIYDDSNPKINASIIKNLCPSTMSSPYRSDRDMLIGAHQEVVEKGQIGNLISFIQNNFNEEINDIRLTDSGEQGRFTVIKKTGETLDLTKYGEGLQRVFEISLYIIACSEGCVFIDEIDSGIHKKLLKPFVNYVRSLAQNYNVQLFVTTHSKECIDIFADKIGAGKLSVYKLKKDISGQISSKFIAGDRLQSLIENFDFDVR